MGSHPPNGAGVRATTSDRSAQSPTIRHLAGILRNEPSVAWTTLLTATAFSALVVVPAALVNNPFFVRMVPVRPLDYAFLAVAAPLIGLTFALARRQACSLPARSLGGGLLTFLAVACPTCNAAIVAAIGTSGALAYFAPIQPILGVAGLALLVAVLRRQLTSSGRVLPLDP